MTVENLIRELSKYNKDKVVVLTEPDLVSLAETKQ